MTETTKTPRKRGGLPDDDGLKAFASAASNAFQAPPVRRRAPTTDTPGPEAAPTPAPTSAYAVEPAPEPALLAVANPGARSSEPAVVVEVQVPQLGERGQEAGQCTIMVSSDVRKRFAHYQLTQKMTTGHEPTNAVVVRRAVLHAKKHDLFVSLRDALRYWRQPAQEEDSDPDGLFGEVPTRRTARGSVKDSRQQSFRPSSRELAVIDALASAYAFPNRSDFLNSALDAFLPPLPEAARRRSTGQA
ncbi:MULTISPECIES: hypothetical protein [unclassified Streptomyces]|uniref:hypothetical protein n=1 Tax=unclassified Streptomyces TaxID=2593676 RepID=UPI0029B90C0A|nr:MULTISPECIES: hypothetical protein [unclassified Streptomyces]MDX3771252.1 hypothetical protein [Streptomyces sp. AK08-01B]MDX3820709.1 hypothetical protein [Streptomyces sp. AK08-01A]